MRWNIVTDSSCDMRFEDSRRTDVCISSVPFAIRIDERDYIDDDTMDTLDMLNAMERSRSECRTACPSPQSWAEQFERAEHSIAITISSQLSGSMNAAVIAREMVLEKYPEKKIAVIDSQSAGPALVLAVERILDTICDGLDFECVVEDAKALLKHTCTVFALSSFGNLVKSGRMSKIAGFIAQKFSMWGIGIGQEGKIAIKGKARGAANALSMLIEDMKEQTYAVDQVIISHCHNSGLAETLQTKVREFWPRCEVSILKTRGLCSYYAERGGLIICYGARMPKPSLTPAGH